MSIWHGRGEAKCGQRSGSKTRRNIARLQNPNVDGTMILKWIYRKQEEYGVGWIRVAQDTNKWRVPVNTVNKLGAVEDA